MRRERGRYWHGFESVGTDTFPGQEKRGLFGLFVQFLSLGICRTPALC